MVRRQKRTELPPDPAGVVRALRVCRSEMQKVCAKVKPMGRIFHGASIVITAIDSFALLLTGHPDYFHAEPSSASQGRREEMAEQAARERGDKPWHTRD